MLNPNNPPAGLLAVVEAAVKDGVPDGADLVPKKPDEAVVVVMHDEGEVLFAAKSPNPEAE